MKTEWKRAPAFAEVAEALGINTTDVLAMWAVVGTFEVGVLYTTDDVTQVIFEARLVRAKDGILRLERVPEETDLRIEDMFRGRDD